MNIKDNKRISEIVELKRNGRKIPEVEEFFTKPNTSIKLKKQISKDIKLYDLIDKNIQNQRRAINNTLKSTKLFKIIGDSFTLFDISNVLINASEGNLSPTMILSLNPTYGLLAIVFDMEINKLEEDLETMMFENIYTWRERENWKESDTYEYFNNTDLLLQYTVEKDKFNYTVPTSIRILNKELAKEIFGFYPKYVNYDMPRGEKEFLPRYYAPFMSN